MKKVLGKNIGRDLRFLEAQKIKRGEIAFSQRKDYLEKQIARATAMIKRISENSQGEALEKNSRIWEERLDAAKAELERISK